MKNKKIIFIALLVILITAFTGCTMSFGGRDYVVKINGEKISISEYNIYLYEQKKIFEQKGGEDIWETDFDGVPAQEVAKQNAVNSILIVKTSVEQAKSLGIKLNEEDKSKVKADAEKFCDEIGTDEMESLSLTEKKVYNVLLEGRIQKKVYEYITDGFEISKADFESYFNNYYEENKKELNNVKAAFIFINTSDLDSKSADYENLIIQRYNKAEQIYERAIMQDDFLKLQEQYSDSKERGIKDIKTGELETAVEDAVYSTDKNKVSDIIQTGNGYYIIKVYDIIKPDIKELKTELKIQYVNEKKQEIFQNQCDKWSSETTIEKNEKIWDSISIS